MRRILLHPDPALVAVAEEISAVDAAVRSLAADMLRLMEGANGAGLAAPQVGESLRLTVLARTESLLPGNALINPEILEISEAIVTDWEGCLSLPGHGARVERAASVVVRGITLEEREITLRVEGFAARLVQHEVDHLDGILFFDRLPVEVRQSYLAEWDRIRRDARPPARGI